MVGRHFFELYQNVYINYIACSPGVMYTARIFIIYNGSYDHFSVLREWNKQIYTHIYTHCKFSISLRTT